MLDRVVHGNKMSWKKCMFYLTRSGLVVGFTDIGHIANEVATFERSCCGNREASHVLVLMVQGIFSSLHAVNHKFYMHSKETTTEPTYFTANPCDPWTSSLYISHAHHYPEAAAKCIVRASLFVIIVHFMWHSWNNCEKNLLHVHRCSFEIREETGYRIFKVPFFLCVINRVPSDSETVPTTTQAASALESVTAAETSSSTVTEVWRLVRVWWGGGICH